MPYTESDYENAVLQLFQEQLGYTHLYGPDVEQDDHSPLLRTFCCLVYNGAVLFSFHYRII